MRDEFTVHTLPKWARYNTIVSMISLYFIVMTSLGPLTETKEAP